jgi:hypothetical protein
VTADCTQRVGKLDIYIHKREIDRQIGRGIDRERETETERVQIASAILIM